ncbi:hypothetical protein [Catenovulum adriaticum]|uniref:Orphan protein n=1 Tax=Catenovulum adriaticum TaxID=2984846 RepID=A0ABY7AJJ5_9ALTE|nr:hypothetical protein [Catenovulum sp. TS8]WAJ69291.1 hypothetical protein OLW01_08835 [Catenovulum sp. TS8]
MKELISVHHYLVGADDLADWHENNELAADNYNQVIHTVYQMADDDIETEQLEGLLEQVWHALAADEYLSEFEDESEIMLWVETFLKAQNQ